MGIELYPLIFEPNYKNYIWGGRNLERFGKTIPSQEIVAESWEASCHPDGVSIIVNGPLSGVKLTDAIAQFGAAIVGTKFVNKRYPLLIKFIDANDKLSVQVHPSDEYALVNENGEFGKNEMWFILSAEPGAYIYYGLNEGVTKDQFKHAIQNGSVESCLNKIYVTEGDAIYIPAGTVHAINKGIVLIEVQQNSNITYRVFDYNRLGPDGKPRPLHIDKALEVIDFSGKRKNKKQKGIRIHISAQTYKTILAANKYFAVELWEINDTVTQETNGEKFYIYTLFKGSGNIIYSQGKMPITQGQSILIPAQLGKYILEGKFSAIKSYVPDLKKDIYFPLTSLGFGKDFIKKHIS